MHQIYIIVYQIYTRTSMFYTDIFFTGSNFILMLAYETILVYVTIFPVGVPCSMGPFRLWEISKH